MIVKLMKTYRVNRAKTEHPVQIAKPIMGPCPDGYYTCIAWFDKHKLSAWLYSFKAEHFSVETEEPKRFIIVSNNNEESASDGEVQS